MTRFIACARFELKDGRELVCLYGIERLPGSWYVEPEVNVGDPVYYLDGEEVEVKALPRGLDKVANQMYMATWGEYDYREKRA